MPELEWPRWPELDADSFQVIQAALLSGRLAVSGPPSQWPAWNVRAALALADAVGRRYVTLTASGSSAIVTALQAAGVGPGDVVLLPATTWVACATAVLRVGAQPAFFDGTPDSPCQIGHSPVTSARAVLGVHLYAQQCDMAAIRRRFPDALLIEDASHSQLARTAGGSAVGSLGDISIMSTQASKVLISGEGGVVLTDDDELAARIDSLVMDSRRRAATAAPHAPNELEPAMRQHGANHAMPELSAALLLDQLNKLPEQARRRARGLSYFLSRLADKGWSGYADEGARRSGGFYGLVVRLPEWVTDPAELARTVHRRCGVVLDRVYPPVPEGPLYRPATVKNYQHIGEVVERLSQARHWHDRHVVLPHPVFLANEPMLDTLVDTLGEGDSAARKPVTRRINARRPTIEVVMLTRGKRPATLTAALESVADQQGVDADVSVTVWLDQGPRPSEPAVPPARLSNVRLTMVGHTGALPAEPWARVAALRQLAIDRWNGDYLAFIDDDNLWEPDHLASLLALIRKGYSAAHSWRRMIDAHGRPARVSQFPWLPPGEEAVKRLADLAAAGIMSADRSVIRDVVHHPAGGPGMVDIGEWLFDSRVLPLFRLTEPRTPEEVAERIGEDDILLRQMLQLGVPTASTRRATLLYRLGGQSNPETVTG